MSTPFKYNPRPYLRPPPAIPSTPTDRLSTASAPFSSIGNILASPYDTDDSDLEDDVLRTPADDVPAGPVKARGGDKRLTMGREKLAGGMIKSVHVQEQGEEITFGGTGMGNNSNYTRGITQGGGKRITIIDFPSPSLRPSPKPEPQTPPRPLRAYNPPTYPSPSRPGLLSPHAARPALYPLAPPRSIPLPPPSSPISPLLAAPPSAHPPSLPRLIGQLAGNRDSTTSTNESIRGFDLMREKKALFRGGEEELVAFSPRIKRLGQNRLTARMSTVDFWKRFSVVGAGVEGKFGKESEWLSTQQNERRSIKKYIIITLVLIVILIAAGVTVAVIMAQSKPKAAVINGKDA